MRRARERSRLECGLGVVPSAARRAPGAVCRELPGERVVLRENVEHLVKTSAQRRVADRREHLHPPREVAWHQIGRAEQVPSLRSAPEPVDAGVLEETPDDRSDADRVRETGLPGAEAADAARDQLDSGARLGGIVERVDQFLVDEAVQFHRDPPLGGGLLSNQLEQPCAHPDRCDERCAEFLLAAVAGEQVESRPFAWLRDLPPATCIAASSQRTSRRMPGRS
jgi:hypothetical protein